MALKCLDLSQFGVFDRVCGWCFDLFVRLIVLEVHTRDRMNSLEYNNVLN